MDMIDPFQAFLTTAWRSDFDGARADAAPGETFATVRGVTAATWENAQWYGVVPTTVPLTAATDDQLASVLRWCCWSMPGADKLAEAGHGGLAIVLAAMAMASGAESAVKILQRVVGASVDGALGPHTLAAVLLASGRDLIGDYTKGCIAYFSGLAKAPEFLDGWTRRANVFAAVGRQFDAQITINAATSGVA